jgi:hypothetical protein
VSEESEANPWHAGLTSHGRPAFAPGNPGGGRPKGSIGLRQILRNRLARAPERADRILSALEARAEDGDVPAIKLLLDSVDGLLAVKIEGLSEHEIQARLTRAMLALRDRLPPEHHGAIVEAMREALIEEGGDDDA